MFPEPPKCNYNLKGAYFSIGPYNSFQSAPVYNNLFSLTTYNKNAGYQYEMEGQGWSTITTVQTLNFGAKTEFGYLGDALHITFPLRASYGNLGRRVYSFNGSAGSNIFVGGSNWKHFKFGICYYYHYSSLNKSSDYSSTDDVSIYESVGISNAKMGIASLNW